MKKDTEIYHRFLFELERGYKIVRIMTRPIELKKFLENSPDYIFAGNEHYWWYGGYEAAIFEKEFNHYLLYLDAGSHDGEVEISLELFNIEDEAIGDEAAKKLCLEYLVKNVNNRAKRLASKKMYLWNQKEKKWQLKKLSEIH